MATAIRQIDIEKLVREYRELQEVAPQRRGTKRYFVGHNGVPSSGAASNRREEHIAIALVNLQRSLALPNIGEYEFVDYQVPLKSAQTDGRIGKIDILGLTTSRSPLVVELKVTSHTGGRSDPPITALLEGLRYAAIISANLQTIADEAKELFGACVDKQPSVLVLGEASWWQAWRDLGTAPLIALHDLTVKIRRALGLVIEFGEMADVMIEYGGNGLPPSIQPTPAIRALNLDDDVE